MASAALNTWPVAARIVAERVLLEPLTLEHADEMVDVLAAPDLYEYIGGAAPSIRELRERYVDQSRGQSPDGAQGWLNWIIRRQDSGDAIGFTQATLTRDEPGFVADIAWLVNPRHQGNGYASEAARAMSGWLLAHHVVRLVAFVSPENKASIGVARHLGMHHTDVSVEGEDAWES